MNAACFHCAKPNHSYRDCRNETESEIETITNLLKAKIFDYLEFNERVKKNAIYIQTLYHTFKIQNPNDVRQSIVREGFKELSSYNCKSNSSTPENQLESSLYKLWDYCQSIYHEKKVISAFKTQLFSGHLQNKLEIEIDNELLPNTENFWNIFEKSICLPEVYINDNKISALIYPGASISVISLKLSKAGIIRSLKLVFRPDSRKMKMANGVEIESQGKLENLHVRINESESTVNSRIMDDLSYD